MAALLRDGDAGLMKGATELYQFARTPATAILPRLNVAAARRALGWLPIIAVITAWLATISRDLWYYYGAFRDDYWIVFRTGLDTVYDWRAAFSGAHVNVLYFYLLSYLPLKLQLAIPGLTLPDYPPQDVALYRGLMAYNVVLHALILLLYACLVRVVTRRQTIALLATALLAVNPLFVFWSTELDSRLVGLLFALPGIAMLLGLDWRQAPLTRGLLLRMSLAGGLLTIGCLTHYTALYLVCPLLASYWLAWLVYCPDKAKIIRAGLACAVGLVLPALVVDLVGRLVLHLPDMLASYAALAQANVVVSEQVYGHEVTYAEKAQEWWAEYLKQDGPALLGFTVLGGLALLVPRPLWRTRVRVPVAVALVATLALGIGMTFSARVVPYHTQAILQPVLMLVAAVGIATLGDVAARAAWAAVPLVRGAVTWRRVALVGRYVLPCAIAAGIAWPTWQQTATGVLPTRTAFGQMLDFAPRPLVFTPPYGRVVDQAHFDEAGTGISPAQLLDMDARVALYDCAGQDCIHFPDRSKMIEVASVTADSSLTTALGTYGPGRAFDGGISQDGITDWISERAAEPHWLEIAFAQPYELDELVLANRPQAIRPDSLDVYGQIDGTWLPLYHGESLSKSPVVHARWSRAVMAGVRVVFRTTVREGQRQDQAEADEIYFPGYRVALPPSMDRPTLKPLQILRVEADSTQNDNGGIGNPRRVVEYQPEWAHTSWLSRRNRGPHFVELQFAGSYELTNVQVVNALQSQVHNVLVAPIDAMEVWLLTEHGWDRVWAGQDLHEQVVVGAAWPATKASAARIVVTRRVARAQEVDYAVIQQVVFPGYFTVFDWSEAPGRLQMNRVQPTGTRAGQGFNNEPFGPSRLFVDCAGARPGTAVMLAGQVLAVADDKGCPLTVSVPPELYRDPGRYDVYLQDDGRESNRVPFTVEP